jgi:hypothetical protein
MYYTNEREYCLTNAIYLIVDPLDACSFNSTITWRENEFKLCKGIADLWRKALRAQAAILRDRCIAFMLNNFDAVTKTNTFEEMGQTISILYLSYSSDVIKRITRNRISLYNSVQTISTHSRSLPFHELYIHRAFRKPAMYQTVEV